MSQGSVLSPLIFLLFINNLLINTFSVVIFASDISISKRSINPSTLQDKLYTTFENLTERCHKSKLILNPQKTMLVEQFGKKHDTTNMKIIVNEQILVPAESTTSL